MKFKKHKPLSQNETCPNRGRSHALSVVRKMSEFIDAKLYLV